jgi:type VI secretion system protein ImpK
MFLIDKFQQFYGEVLRLRGRVVEGTWVFQTDPTPAGAAPEPRESPVGVWRKLVALLERQSLDASREGGDFGVAIYRRAQYAMAALADEIFINLQWAGREAWREHLLEAKLFGSHRAGEELFERIDALLREHDALYGELARVYLMVLALGFQGKFRGRSDAHEEIESYRRRLFRFVYGREPQVVHGDERIVPQAYAATLDEASTSKLPYLKPWIWTLVLVLVVWLAGSHLLWHNATSALEPVINEIVGAPAAAGGGQ